MGARISASRMPRRSCCGAKVLVCQRLHAAKFTLEESLNAAKHMAVRRTYAKAIGGKTKSPFPVSVDTAAKRLSLSPMTEPTSTTTKTVTQLDTPPPGQDDGDNVTKPKPRQI